VNRKESPRLPQLLLIQQRKGSLCWPAHCAGGRGAEPKVKIEERLLAGDEFSLEFVCLKCAETGARKKNGTV
jgi:hypothetical protein